MLLELVRIGVDCDTLRVCPLSEVGRGGTIGCGVFRVSPEPVRKGFEPCDIMEDRKFVEPHAFVTLRDEYEQRDLHDHDAYTSRVYWHKLINFLGAKFSLIGAIEARSVDAAQNLSGSDKAYQRALQTS